MSTVIVQANDFDVILLLQPASILLKAELGRLEDIKRTSRSAKFPNYIPVAAIDLVYTVPDRGGI